MDGTINPRTKVELNGQKYPLVPGTKIQKTDIAPYALKVASGDPKYGDGTVASSIVIRDLRAGLGIQFARADKPGHFWDSTLDTRYPYQVVLPPRTTAFAAGSPITAQGNFGRFLAAIGSVVCLADGSNPTHLHSTANGSTWTDRKTATAGNFYQFGPTYAPPSGTPALYAVQTVPSVGANIAYSTNGTAWTEVAPTDSASGHALGIGPATVYDGKFVAIAYDRTSNVYVIAHSVDPTTAASWTILSAALPERPLAIATFADAAGEPAIFLAGNGGLYTLDFYSLAVNKVLDFEAMRSVYTGQMMCVHNGALYVVTVRGVLRYDRGGIATLIGPFGKSGEDGLSAKYGIYVFALQSDGDLLWALVAGNLASQGVTNLLAYNDTGWHRIWRMVDSNNAELVGVDSLTFLKTTITATSGYSRVYVGPVATYPPQYFELAVGTDNPLVVSGYTYEKAAGILVTSYEDGGFAEVPKGAYELHVNYKLQDADNSILVEYQKNNDLGTSWTTLGTITGASDLANVVKILKFGSSNEGISFQNIRFRFTLTRDSGTNTTTPVLLYATLKYVPRPATKYSFNFQIDMTEEALAEVGLNFASARSALETARSSVPLLNFYETPALLGGSLFQVLVATKPEAWDWVEARQEGKITVTLLEVV